MSETIIRINRTASCGRTPVRLIINRTDAPPVRGRPSVRLIDG
jgi:hypothetical protein